MRCDDTVGAQTDPVASISFPRCNIIHRDLKPENIMLASNDEQAPLKLVDFGFAKSLHGNTLAETVCGTWAYCAPEIRGRTQK